MRLIGRERGYHGVGFGGMSVGGIGANRKTFGALLRGVDHLRHTHDLTTQRVLPRPAERGADLADELERLVALHDPSTIAAVIVEPVAGSTGVLSRPRATWSASRNLRQARHPADLRRSDHRIRTGRRAVRRGLLRRLARHHHLRQGHDQRRRADGRRDRQGRYPRCADDGPEKAIELLHGYTYSGHPLACAACIATLDIYQDEGLFERAAELAPYWEEAVHSLKGLPHVIDIRNIGLIGAIELEPARASRASAPIRATSRPSRAGCSCAPRAIPSRCRRRSSSRRARSTSSSA